MKKKTIAGLIAIVAIAMAVMFAGCVEEEAPSDTVPAPVSQNISTPVPTKTSTLTDEMKIIELILKKAEYTNNWDWKSVYGFYSPGYRNAYPYAEFEKDRKDAWTTMRMFGAEGNLSIENINIKTNENIAYATYILRIGTDIWDSRAEGNEDLWIKYNGQWYDMSEAKEPTETGYNGWNEEDVAVLHKVEMTRQK